MRVAAFTELTGPSGVSILDRPTPEPGPNEAVIDVEACSINRHDLWILQGDSAMVEASDLPFVSGLDASGTVRAVGDGVDGVAPEDSVVLCPNETCGTCRFCRDGPENRCASFSLYHGALAETALVDADRLVPIPDGLDSTAAAAIPTAYMTAFHMLRRADVGPGDLVFVPGATGGVGVASVQLAGVRGASTIGTSSSASKLEAVAELGCDHMIHETNGTDLAAEVAAIGRPDVVINHLGGPYTELGLEVVRRDGRVVVCGRTAGNRSKIDVAGLFLGHKRLLGSTMGTQHELERLLDLAATGRIDPVIDETFTLEETADAFARMRDRDAVGKIVVTM
jgi:NADPH:quinone reductase-like Zn-dependent oxidoreductase